MGRTRHWAVAGVVLLMAAAPVVTGLSLGVSSSNRDSLSGLSSAFGTSSSSNSPKGYPDIEQAGRPAVLLQPRDSVESVPDHSIHVGKNPSQLAYDSKKGEIFVANSGSDNVSVISDTKNKVIATISLFSEPTGIAYDAGKNEVFVANGVPNNVSVISDATNAVVADVSVVEPNSVAYDSAKGEVFVTNESAFVSVINDTTDAVVDVISIPMLEDEGPDISAIVYDAGSSYLSILDYSGCVDYISDVTDSFVGCYFMGEEADANAEGYDSGTGDLYVSAPGLAEIFVIGPNGTQLYNEYDDDANAFAYDPSQSEMYLSGCPIAADCIISDSTYDLIATLPSGGGAIVYDSDVGKMYVVSGSDNVSVIPAIPPYSVHFTEKGLPSGTEWWVNLTEGQSFDSTKSTLSFKQWNGTYQFNVTAANRLYRAVGGAFTVVGAKVTENVTFSLAKYLVTFKRTGLPSGTEWWVNLTDGQSFSSTKSTLSFKEWNGTYRFSIATTDKFYRAAGGTFTVVGAKVTENVKFTLAKYGVTFKEIGLPPGTEWWVNLTNGQSFHTKTASLSFSELNGTYSFSTASANKSYTGPSGEFKVDGANVTEDIIFSADPQASTPSYSGCSSAARWRPARPLQE